MKKNIGIAVVLGIFILSVFLTDIVPTSESIAKDLKINERLNNHPEISRMSGKENGIVLSDLPQVCSYFKIYCLFYGNNFQGARECFSDCIEK